MDEINPVETTLCRTCLQCAEGLESLDEKNDSGLSTKDMLLSFCTVNFDEVECSLQNHICKDCSLEILRAYNFKLKCERNDYILRERIRSAFYTTNNLGRLLYNNKDKRVIISNSGVYRISCNDCDAKYIGKTDRIITKRFKEHTRAFGGLLGHSEIADHCIDKDHYFDLQSVKILHSGCHGRHLSALESLEIVKTNKLGNISLKTESTDDIKNYEISLKQERIDDESIKNESDLINLLDFNVKIESDDFRDESYEDPDHDDYDASYDKKIKRKRLKKSDSTKKIVSKSIKKKTKHDYQSDGEKEVRIKSYKVERKKKIKGISEINLTDDSAATLGYRKIYECPKCHAFFKTFRMVHKHMIKLHQIVLNNLEHYNTLWDCVQKTDDTQKPELKLSMLDFKNPRYKCLDCTHMSKNFDAMKKHIIGEHRGERYIYCDECDYKTTHLTMLVRHKRLHTGERRFACSQCDYRSTSNYQLNLHMTALHTEHRAFVCDVCAQAFKTKLSLLNHITRVHINKREHQCGICSKRFNMKKDLKNHLAVHSGERPHVCEHCGMAFTQKANLEKHVHVIHTNSEDRPFPCMECSYRAKSIYSLRSHMHKHNRTQHFLCHLCNHKSTTKYALKIHVQRHLGDKQHHCKSCSYSCYDSQTLVVHNRIHTGERPFPCDLCPYRSRTKQRLHNHMKSHLNEQKFSCQHCPYRSNYKANLVVHLKKNCGRDSRPYTPRKNQAAINFSLCPTDDGNISVVSADDTQRLGSLQDTIINMESQMKMEINSSPHKLN